MQAPVRVPPGRRVHPNKGRAKPAGSGLQREPAAATSTGDDTVFSGGKRSLDPLREELTLVKAQLRKRKENDAGLAAAREEIEVAHNEAELAKARTERLQVRLRDLLPTNTKLATIRRPYFMLASFSDSDVVVLEVLETITRLLAFVISQLHTLILQLHLPPNALTKQNCLGKCANILLLT